MQKRQPVPIQMGVSPAHAMMATLVMEWNVMVSWVGARFSNPILYYTQTSMSVNITVTVVM